MRMPSRTKLIEWYKSLLELGVGSQFKHYYNVGGFAKAKNWCKNLNKIPYFKGMLHDRT